jgi:hypothetical protein
VLLPHAPLDRLAAEGQARLLRSGRSGLVEVFRSTAWTIYELPAATPVLTGPGPAELTFFGHERIEGSVGDAGSYLLRIRYTPYLAVEAGDICLEKGPAGMTRLEARRPGTFTLTVPGPGELLRFVLGDRPAGC